MFALGWPHDAERLGIPPGTRTPGAASGWCLGQTIALSLGPLLFGTGVVPTRARVGTDWGVPYRSRSRSR